jgi:hypothetical protein
VSSQIINPISAGGRILDIFMEIYAITVIAMLAGAFGSFLQRRGREFDDRTAVGMTSASSEPAVRDRQT